MRDEEKDELRPQGAFFILHPSAFILHFILYLTDARALSEISLRHQAPFQRMHLTAV